MSAEKIQKILFDILSDVATDQSQLISGIKVTDIPLERPKNKDNGDWATSIALKISKSWGFEPMNLARILSQKLEIMEGIKSAEVAFPGFINIRLEPNFAGQLALFIVQLGSQYGTNTELEGLSFNLEFVSANPTGPIHLGGTRWAAVGDSLGRILEASGGKITREYYFNDHGVQIDRFAQSLVASYLQNPTPDDGYAGQYIHDIAHRVVSLYDGDLSLLSEGELNEVFGSMGVELMFGDIKTSLLNFGVVFDVFFHEDLLHETHAVERAIEKLSLEGHVYEKDGALWLRTTEFGDDKDRVVIKSDGHPAYMAADIAYYRDKRDRGFDCNIIMLGSDHHGYVSRLMAVCAAFGDKPGFNLEILIGQMVSLLKDGQPIKMSKRAGNIVTLEDLVDAVGVDAARYSLVRSPIDSPLDLDLDVLAKQTNDNPVFYVQYAHARTCAVARNAEVAGVKRTDGFVPDLLEDETESQLLGVLEEFPRIVKTSAEFREPHRVARYLEEVAGHYHRWYDRCRITPQGDEDISDLHRTRLWLNDATGQVLQNGLNLLGVTAPERM